ncbi:MAG: hypothetical protein JSW01_03540 [Candidatus Bathyarchaeota archaeon]|nr:MAG: hypothetical protein JSW01_03540 [Candidatus Bathyarchaeota archaeon]
MSSSQSSSSSSSSSSSKSSSSSYSSRLNMRTIFVITMMQSTAFYTQLKVSSEKIDLI